MSDPRPRPPAGPPPAPTEAATGEWSSATPPDRSTPPAADSPTLTASGQPAAAGDLGIPNPFGRYTVERLLGRGGMGAVYLAHDTQLERPVALKIPAFRGAPSAGQKERFFREARAVAALRHPNICPVFDVDEEHGTLYLTTAYIDGHTLATALKDGPLDPVRAARLIREVADGMEAAHEHGTIHRDLKPHNIMLDGDGEPVVMDFGLARKAEDEEDEPADGPKPPPTADSGLTQMGSVLGTPAYMPPEQARGDLPAIGPRSDVYALGAVLYECLTGRRPFDGPDPASVIQKILHVPPPRPRDYAPGVDPALERVCLKALAKDPGDRYQSMAEFAAALKDVTDPELRVVEPPPLPPRARGPKRKKRRWVIPVLLVGTVLLMLTICVGGPFAAVFWLVDQLNSFRTSQTRSDVEWESITALWQPPPADAGPDALFPPTFEDGRYRLRRHDTEAADAELGIALAGHRAIYAGPFGDVEVRAYRCPEPQGKTILQGVASLAAGRQSGTAAAQPASKRKKAVYVADHPGYRTVTFAFQDELGQNPEFGKLWYGHGWLFWFKTAVPMQIDHFPSKYLVEVSKRATTPPKPPPAPKAPKGDGKKPALGQFGNLGQ